MNMVRTLEIIALAGGVASGSGTLESAAQARPPIQWNDLAFVFVGSLLAVTLVVGLQIALKKEKPARIFSWFFGIAGIYLAASGLSAFAIAAHRGTIAPSSLLFLAVGIGTIIGASIAGRIHRAVFAT
jgi:hypothetical protein